MYICLCQTVYVFVHLELRVVLAVQEHQLLPYFLEIQLVHIPLVQGSHLVLVCLKALVDLANHDLPLHHGRNTRGVLFQQLLKLLIMLNGLLCMAQNFAIKL